VISFPWRRGAGLGLGVALLASCSHDASDLMKTGPKAADYYCAPDGKTADAIEAAMRTSDEDDYGDAIRFAVAVPPGTTLRIEERTSGTRPKVRALVVDGSFKGRECWYPADVDGLLEKP
jgi:hypothetical protein